MGAHRTYSIYNMDGTLYAQGNLQYIANILGISKTYIMPMAKKGFARNGMWIESKERNDVGYELYKDGMLVVEGTLNKLRDFLMGKGIKTSQYRIITYCYNKKPLFGYTILPKKENEGLRKMLKAQKQEEDGIPRYVFDSLEKYGNTIVCGKRQEEIIEKLKEELDINVYRKKDDSKRKYHYLVEKRRHDD